jgi:uncharacterized damage-inducible protein DinB
MKMTDFFAWQLDREAAISRRVLERVPEGRGDWKPHEKSMQLVYLSTLVAIIPTWITMAIEQDFLDLNPPGGSPYAPQGWSKIVELLSSFEDALGKCREALKSTTDKRLRTPWRLLVSGRTVMEAPRDIVIADNFTHLAHHRGQLTVYLRLLGVPVPSIYGPSADDRGFM